VSTIVKGNVHHCQRKCPPLSKQMPTIVKTIGKDQ
jgi:hypothetical protein